MNNPFYRNISGALALMLVALSIIVFDVSTALGLLATVGLWHVLLSVSLALIVYTLSGVQYRISFKSIGIQMKTVDMVIFPITMNLWSLLIPFQGAVVFSTIFFARKYGRTLSSSLSISLFLYMVTVSLTGLLGLGFVFYSDRANLTMLLLLTTIILSPLAVPLLDAGLRWLLPAGTKTHPLLARLSSFVRAVMDALRTLLTDWRLLIRISILKLIQTAVVGTWYWVIAEGLGIELSIVVLMLLSLIGELALIIKVTPDNLGVNQLLSGALLASMGFNPQWGVLISLAASATTLVLIFTLGLYGNHVFMRDHGIRSMQEMVRSFHREKTDSED